MRLKFYFKELSLNPKKEFLFAFGFGFIMLAIMLGVYFLLNNNIIFLGIGCASVIIVPSFYLSRYPSAYKKLQLQRENAFTEMILYFRIYLENGSNTYKAFERVVPLTSEWLREKVQKFLFAVDGDKTVTPYIDFSKNFLNKYIEQVLLSIYQMNEMGYEKSLFDNFIHNNNVLEDLAKKQGSTVYFAKLKNLSIIPLVAAGLVTVLISISILYSIGGVVSGF